MKEKNFTPEQSKAFREYACATLNSIHITYKDLYEGNSESISENVMDYVTQVARHLMLQEGII
jgi:hypothetical protein